MPTTKRILLPIDITHPHTEFLALLNGLVSLAGLQVHLLYVREELPAAENLLRSLGGNEELEKQIAQQANKVFDRIEAELTEFQAQTTREITGGPAAMMIERVAKDEKFELTVLPPGSKNTPDKFLLGRVSSKVVDHAPGTVLLLRGDPTRDSRNIVIGLDGSEQSFQALREAATLFALSQPQTKTTLVNVVSVHPIFTMFSPVEYMTAIESNLKMSGAATLAQGEEILSELGVKNVEMKQVEGNPADSLIAAAKELNASLIVVGAQGRGMVEHFLIGSTSTRLADHSPCPVAVFKGHGKHGEILQV